MKICAALLENFTSSLNQQDAENFAPPLSLPETLMAKEGLTLYLSSRHGRCGHLTNISYSPKFTHVRNFGCWQKAGRLSQTLTRTARNFQCPTAPGDNCRHTGVYSSRRTWNTTPYNCIPGFFGGGSL